MEQPIRILADENIPLVEFFFGPYAEICRKPGRDISAADLQGVQALLVRSVTRVDRQLLDGSDVQFVGSATIGMDHIDLNYLESRGIAVANAPGSNARSVVEYVVAALFALHDESNDWRNKTIAIIGVGEVGGRLAQLLQELDVPFVC